MEDFRVQSKGYDIFEKKLEEFINKTFDIFPSTIEGDQHNMIYYSKIDGSYMNRVGNESEIKFLVELGITEEIQSAHEGKNTVSLGFNPEENKWYGWSHRAIYGFTIGSTCSPGDCHYNADTPESFAEECLRFWGGDEYSIGDDSFKFTKGEGYDGLQTDGVLITYTYNNLVPNERLRGTLYQHFSPFPKEWGKGSWIAQTMDDAKQMAIDFANSVS